MEAQIFVVASGLSFLNPSTHKVMLSGFSYCRGGFHHIAQTTNFRKVVVVKGSLLQFSCHLDFRVFCRMLLGNY